jgi:hypothetical protein
MELQRNNAKPQQEYPHVQHPQNRNAYRDEAAEMKVFLNTGDNSDHFLFHPQPPKIWDKHLTGAPPTIPSHSQQ